MRRAALVLPLLLALLSLAAPAQAGAGTGSIVGTLTDGRTGLPVQTSIELDENGQFADFGFSDGTGGFAFSGIEGTYELVPQSGDYRGVRIPVTVTAGATVRRDVVLTPNPTISGKVTDAAGRPVAGLCPRAVFGAIRDTAGYGCTDATGAYRFRLPAGTYDIHFVDLSGALADQWWPRTSESKARSVKVGTKDVTGIDAVLDPAAVITSGLADENGPIFGCLTALDQQGRYAGQGCTEVDPETYQPVLGPITVRGLRAGTYVLEGHAQDTKHVVRRSAPLTVTTGATRTVADVFTPVGGRITGRIVDPSGNPVLGACATIKTLPLAVGGWSTEAGLSCDESYQTGVFSITGLEAGSYPVEVFANYQDNFATVWLPGSPDSRGAVKQTVALGGTLDVGPITLAVGGTLSGHVSGSSADGSGRCVVAHSAATGEPIGQIGCAGPDGAYRIIGLGTNDYTVQVAETSTWYGGTSAKKATPVHVTAGQDLTGIDLAVR